MILQPVPPFRLDLTVWALRRVPINEMDRWDGTAYRRVFNAGKGAVEAVVTQKRGPDRPELTVLLDCEDGAAAGRQGRDANAMDLVVRALSRMLGLDVDLTPFYSLAFGDWRLGPLARRFQGLKPPRFPSVFEGLVNGIACQQLSLIVGITLLNRISAAYGTRCGDGHAFPTPGQLARAAPADLRSLGFSTRKAENIVSLARAVDAGDLDPESFATLDDAGAEAALDSIDGVGRWTAQYVELRGLGKLDVFPADDVGSQNKIRQWLSLEQRPGYEETNRRLAGFRPYRGLVYFHLLLNNLAERGFLSPAE